MDAERRAGKARGLLHGIPIIVKDNYETVGMQTADGSVTMVGWIPPDELRPRKEAACGRRDHNCEVYTDEFAYGISHLARCLVQPEIRMYWIETRVGRVVALRRGHCRELCSCGHGQRHVRFDPHSCFS